MLRIAIWILVAAASFSAAAAQEEPPSRFNLTVVVQGVDSAKGVVGLVLFSTPNGWPEDVADSFRHMAVPSQPGTSTMVVSDLPAGRYAIAVIHDLNENMRLDKNWLGKPKEQWGMSNNPHAMLRAPSFQDAEFDLMRNEQITIRLQ
ncbi:MAG TPA: DUF2141 domain-containing protein [Terriglobales bacterium]|nr:DUF2141 domain-containing protein [Terriglobales bacterium]